ncbi:restriction endonuclease subunit S [Lactobacillus amylovorus]|uniref:Restriction endonuclease subunit S n=1 Tax=Lactobacillus amylovorus TaxID=1604 RepID=A0AAW6B842_LACAM|nr:restriction endonuclease subunit S [Lactobacillus amylovorus]MDA6089015.1 restriction endonuclease subunit S [Lactobacillus amylovorus]MDB6246115.1 restriction endonuclease subunit S [Lactobacillus amylovorus]
MVTWEQRKLGTAIKIIKDKNKNQHSYRAFSISNIKGFIAQDEQFGKDNTYSKTDKSTNYIVKPGMFAYNPARINVGSIAYQNQTEPVLVSSLYEIFQTNSKIDDSFLMNWFKTSLFNRQIKRLEEGGVRQYFFIDKMKETEIKLPSISEQNQISKLLQLVNKNLDLQQRKLKELQQVKQTLSQFLLNGNTHTRPTLRLNGFEDIWKENKLKDIAKISMGQSPSSNNYNKKGNGKILIQGNADIDNGGIRPRVWTTEITKLANKNDILLTVRAPVGELAITNREVVIGRGIAAIKGNKFIYNLLVQKNKEHFWDRISSGSTFKSISSNDIKQLKVYIPSEKEETLIASVLETIKNKIDFQNERINVINKLKKYLLTNLFI